MGTTPSDTAAAPLRASPRAGPDVEQTAGRLRRPACPDVALAIDAAAPPGPGANPSIPGQASVEIVDGVVEECLAAARRTMDVEAAAEFEQHVRGMHDQMENRDHAALGALPPRRRRPNSAIPAGTVRADPVLTVEAHARKGSRTPSIGERPGTGLSHRPVRQSNRITALIGHGSVGVSTSRLIHPQTYPLPRCGRR
jgi:hypothetical protein